MKKDLNIRKLTPYIGAEIIGLDLSKKLKGDEYDFIYNELIVNQVIFIKNNKKLTPENHLNFAKTFGKIEPPHPVYPHVKNYPEIVLLENDMNKKADTDTWHTDVTFKANPPFASILHSINIPSVGGDTLWSSMISAYEALPNYIKKEISELRAVHDMSDFRNNFTINEPNGEAKKLMEAYKNFGTSIHPLVKFHPVSKKPFLYANPGFTMQIVGKNSSDSRRLLNYLFDHMTQPQFQLRYKWSENVLAMWDNRCTMHLALSDYYPHHRKMHRVTIINDKRID